ncbi:MAG TPA: patatin-like phospholipase family protein [Gammaproteobacteria bacterium]|nr:patatin-like phospholipase family protein [Gammaproteobacteria bacterium]
MRYASGVGSLPVHKNGLILPGGGARAAYQVGVLKAIAELLPEGAPNPFPVICGTSAGSINAVLLASYAMRFHEGVRVIANLWENLRIEQVFRVGPAAALGTLARLVWAALRGAGRSGIRSLLDNQPLRETLERQIHFANIRQAIDSGALDAVAVVCSGYTSARSVAFFEGRKELQEWSRMRRDGRRAELSLDHVMASCALPIIFPAVRLGLEYFGDGALRQGAPLSPAIHLGADRLLVIAVRNEAPNPLPTSERQVTYPSFGQIGGYLLDTLFMDSLYMDLERLRRVNELLRQMPEGRAGASGSELKPIDVHIITPSDDMRDIAARHARAFPRSVKFLLRGIGARSRGGRQLMSYLLFESAYCRELVALGYRDGMANRELLEALCRESGVARERLRAG